MPQIGFVGLGVMGERMAGHLVDSGHAVIVWNRSPGKSDALQSKGASVAQSLAELAPACGVIFICVSRTEDVEQVITELLKSVKPNTLFVDHSTIEPTAAKKIASLLESKGHRFIDAPVTGGEKGAIEGTLTVFCGGHREDFEFAKPIMEAYGRNVRLVGESGSGQLMKMANQISVALCVLAMSECLVFAHKAGLDLSECIELIGAGAGASWSLANYGPKVVSRDWAPGFAVDLQQKDLRYALETAREIGASLPGTALTHQLFAALQYAGRGADATPALFEVIEGLSGGSN
jgi:3-hydroxyisobutyrate dehydrogenase-like beta-hydroxyacid dehydrogenase